MSAYLPTTSYQAHVFDFDGTIAETGNLNLEALCAALANAGAAVDVEWLSMEPLTSIEAVRQRLRRERGVTLACSNSAIHRMGRAYWMAHTAYRSAIAKISDWLCRQQQADGSWTDRWHTSPYYATHCAVTALRQFGHPSASMSLARARRWVVSTQREQGLWGTWAGTREETAYAIQILAYTGGAAVPDQTIEFLSAADDTAHPPLWLAKDPYCPTAIVEAALLAAVRLADPHSVGRIPRSGAA